MLKKKSLFISLYSRLFMRRSRLLRRRNRRNFWNDSDDEIEEIVVINNNDPSDIEVIEIRPPRESSVLIRAATNIISTQPDDIPALLPPSFSVQQQLTTAWYMPPSLHEHSRRYSILPAFPTSFYNNHPPLLLANVPSMSEKHQRLIEDILLFSPSIYST